MKPTQSVMMLVGACLLCGTSSFGAVPSPATQALLDANPGMRAMFNGERLIALYAVPFATDSDPLTNTDDFVAAFLTAQADALGVDNVSLVLDNKINIRNDKFTVYTYAQQIEGLLVDGSVVKIPVLLGGTEKIGYVGIGLSQTPAAPLPPDVLTGTNAVDTVAQSPTYGHLTTFGNPEKVIFDDGSGTLHRTWRFFGYDDDESYRFFVDTNTGNLVWVFDLVFSAGVSGTVTGDATPCCAPPDPGNAFCPDVPQACLTFPYCTDGAGCPTEDHEHSCCCGADNPDNFCSPDPLPIPIPGAQVSVYAGPDNCASNPEGGALVAQTLTDENGDYQFTGISPPVRVVPRLIGDSLTVTNCNGDPNCVGEESLECADVLTDPAGVPVDLEFNSVPDEYGTAEVNAFAVAQTTHDWFKGLQPTYPGIDQPLEIMVNRTNACGAWFDFFPRRIRLYERAPGECNNTAFSTVVSHEYGHFIVSELIPSRATGPCGISNWRLYEGASDTIAALVWSTECVAADYQLDNTCLRNVDEPNYPLAECAQNYYTAGLALAGAVWDTRKNLITTFGGDELAAKAVIDPLFADFLFITDGLLDESVLVEMLIVDDDDLDLSNSTPHFNEIIDAFVNDHAWSNPVNCDPDQSVIVSWQGPTTGPPVEGVDYVVHCEVNPPHVTLVTTEKDLEPVVRWTIGRDGAGLDFGTIRAEWAAPSTHNIVVRVGTDPAAPCRDLSVVDIPAQSSANWSSVVLNLDRDLKTRAQCYANANGDGGLISGTITGSVGLTSTGIINAVGIGAEGSLPGTLQVDGTVKRMDLQTIPDGSVLEVGTLGGVLSIAGELSGAIDVYSIRAVSAGDFYEDHGKVEVQGIGISDGDITVTSLAGGEIVIAGSYAGTMTIKAMEETDDGGVLAPRIQTGELTGTIQVSDSTKNLLGTIEIGTAQTPADIGASGLIDVRSALGDNAAILVHGDVEKTGKIVALNGLSASSSSVEVEGNLAGVLQIGDGMAVPAVVSDVAGSLLVDGVLSGRIEHHGSLLNGGQISVLKLNRGAKILIDKLADGSITVQEGTLASSLIRTIEGLGVNGSILIDTPSGIAPVGANGDIQVGPDLRSCPYPSVTFLGCIELAHDLNGAIDVNGCPTVDTPDFVSICVHGAQKGPININDDCLCEYDIEGVDGDCIPACP